MPSRPVLYLWMAVAAAMAALFDVAGGHGVARSVLLALVAAESLLLSALTWPDGRR